MKKNMCAASKSFSVKTLSALLFGTAGVFLAPTMLGLAPQAQAAVPAVKLPDFSDLVDAVGPAVVNIRTTERLKMNVPGAGGQDEQEMQEFLRRF
ncbi:MAG: serine peptidase, partial [Janthinobacterium sp.]